MDEQDFARFLALREQHKEDGQVEFMAILWSYRTDFNAFSLIGSVPYFLCDCVYLQKEKEKKMEEDGLEDG